MTRGLLDVGDITTRLDMTACPFYHIKGCDSLYIDFLEAPKEVVRLYAATPVKKRKGPRGGVSDPFPNKLREMLMAASHEGLNSVVDWKHHGRSFGIYDPETFVQDVLPRFFKQTKLTSFQRQLNLYGFLRVTSGPEQGCYFHPMFLQSRPDLLPIMVRDRTNPWTRLVEPHEATACNTFADIRPQSLLDMKGLGATSFPPNETQEASNANSKTDNFMREDDFVDMLDPVFDLDDSDNAFYKTFPAIQVPSSNLQSDQIKVVSPSSSDVDDSTDDESLTGLFAGQRFHFVKNEEKVLALEGKIPIYHL